MELRTKLSDQDDVPSRLIQTAMRLLAEQGPAALKVREIASASGLSTMVVYSHFGGIPELLGAVVEHGFNQLAQAFAELPVTDDPVADLCRMALTTRDHAQANPHLYDLMFGLSMRSTYRPLEDAGSLAGARCQTFQLAYDHVTTACERLFQSGRVDRRDPRIVAGQLWSMVHGFVVLELANHFDDLDDPPSEVLLPLGAGLAVSLGDDPARAVASHRAAAEAHAISYGKQISS